MKVAVAVAAACALLVSTQAADAAGRTVFPRDCRHEAYKPRQIVIACGDGNLYVTRLHWSHWRTGSALGTGTAHANDCTPNCAAGHFHTYRAQIKLSKPATCGNGVRQFTSLRFTYTGRAPSGPRSYSTPFPCP